MVTLYLLRHAKSSQGDRGLDDKDRPLNARGRGAAAAIGRYFHEQGLRPSLILCSTAQRTRETLEIVRQAARWQAHESATDYVDALYLATPSEILRTVAEVPPATESVLVIGHNPGLHELALSLASAGTPAYPDLLAHLPTGALAVLTSPDATWPHIAASRLALTSFVQPRNLPN